MAFNLRLSPQEDKLLTDYCTRTQRTKTDVLRELIRGLPGESDGWGDVDPEENLLNNHRYLPSGWIVMESGRVEGSYRCHIVQLRPAAEGFKGFEVWVNSRQRAFASTENLLLAIAHAQEIVDYIVERSET